MAPFIFSENSDLGHMVPLFSHVPQLTCHSSICTKKLTNSTFLCVCPKRILSTEKYQNYQGCTSTRVQINITLTTFVLSPPSAQQISSVAITQDQQYIAEARADGSVKVMEFQTRKSVRALYAIHEDCDSFIPDRYCLDAVVALGNSTLGDYYWTPAVLCTWECSL